jgi:glycosidase
VRCLIRLRREMPALTTGSYRLLDSGERSVHAYLREHGDQRVLVVLNFGAEDRVLDLSAVQNTGEVLCSTHLDRSGHLGLDKLDIRPDEGLLVSLGARTSSPGGPGVETRPTGSPL